MDTGRIVTFGIWLLCCVPPSNQDQISSIKSFYLDELCSWSTPSTITITVGDTRSGYNSSGILEATRYRYYLSNFRCTVKLEPDFQHGIIVALRKIDLRPGCLDVLKITDNLGITTNYCINFNDATELKTLTSWGKMTLDFTSSSRTGFILHKGFQLTFTAYRIRTCSSEEFSCKNVRCISKILKCDGHNHCGDRSDQYNCVLSTGGIVAIIFGCLLFVIAFFSCIGYRLKKIKSVARTEMHPPTSSDPSPSDLIQENDLPPSYGNFAPPLMGKYQIAPQVHYPQPPPPYSAVYGEGITNLGYK